eukprot:31302-Pelagococcus_subviridis.AAC.17
MRLELDAHASVRAGVGHLGADGAQRVVESAQRAVARAAAEVRDAAGAGPQELIRVAQRAREEGVRGVQAPVRPEVSHGDVRVARDGDAFGEPSPGGLQSRGGELRSVELPPERGHRARVRGVRGDDDDGESRERGDRDAEAAGDAVAMRVRLRRASRVRRRLDEANRRALRILEIRREVPAHRRARGVVRADVLHGPLHGDGGGGVAVRAVSVSAAALGLVLREQRGF